VLARFDDIRRLGAGGGDETQPPADTPVPQSTPLPTATLEGTWVLVNVDALNVRTGPGFNYERVGQVGVGETYRILGAIPDYTWVMIDYQGGVGWVKTEFVEILGDLAAVAIVQPPPSPTPAATETPTLPPDPDIVIDNVVLNPPQPIPNLPFTATITLRNAGGGAAGRFAIAATWEPDKKYTATFVEGLAGGQQVQIQLTDTLTQTGSQLQVVIIADLNNEVQELNEGNNNYNITYRVDYPVDANQTGFQLGANTALDLHGGQNDLFWDGYNIAMRQGAQIGQLQGMTFEFVHYDLLSPALVAYDPVGFGVDKVLAGAVFGMITAEGRRAVIRVDNLTPGGPITLSYRVYRNTP
jgi:hypothetical protein